MVGVVPHVPRDQAKQRTFALALTCQGTRYCRLQGYASLMSVGRYLVSKISGQLLQAFLTRCLKCHSRSPSTLKPESVSPEWRPGDHATPTADPHTYRVVKKRTGKSLTPVTSRDETILFHSTVVGFVESVLGWPGLLFLSVSSLRPGTRSVAERLLDSRESPTSRTVLFSWGFQSPYRAPLI